MATKLTKPVRREITDERGRTLIIELTPAGLITREKGRRTAGLHIRGAELTAQRAARQKAAERKAKGLPERKRSNRRKLGVGI